MNFFFKKKPLTTDALSEKIKRTSGRRTALTAGGVALVGAALPGCGGGGEELGQIDSSQVLSSSLIEDGTEYALAAAYVPAVDLNVSAREVYWIEVAHAASLAVRVRLHYDQSTGTPVFYTLSDRPANTGTMYCLDFATLDTYAEGNSSTSRTRFKETCYLEVRITRADGTSVTHFAGKSYATSASCTKTFYSDHNETEWLFAVSGTASSTNWNAAVRFFKAATADMGSNRSAFISEQGLNHAQHDHNHGLTTTYPKFRSSLPSEPTTHAAGVLAHSTGLDTLVLPNHRHAGKYELVKPLGHTFASDTTKAHVHRRINRHMARYGQRLRDESTPTFSNINTKGQRLQSEMSKMGLGGTLTERIGARLESMRTTLDNAAEEAINSIFNSMIGEAQAYDTDSRASGIQRNLNDMTNAINFPIDMILGAATGSSLQFKVGSSLPLFLGAKLGLRFSWTVCKYAASLGLVNNTGSVNSTSHRAIHDSTKGQKFSITAIIDFPDLTMGSFKVDIEISINFSVKTVNGVRKLRIDGVVLDPVFDLDVRKRLFETMEKGVAKLLSRASGIPNINNFTSAVQGQLAGFNSSSISALFSPWVASLQGSVIATSALASACVTLKNYILAHLTGNGRTWAVVEFSPIRLMVINPDTIWSSTAGFRSGWPEGGAWIYSPAAKFIAGTGLSYTNVPVPGASWFVRSSNSAELFAMFGTLDSSTGFLDQAAVGAGGGNG